MWKLHEYWYWYIHRPLRKWGLDIVWKLPENVVYWCIVRAACRVEPNTYPGNVTAEEMLVAFQSKKDAVQT